MKINFWAGLMCALVLSVSCREESDRIISHGTTENEGEYTITRSFAEPDGSVDLSSMSSSSKRLRDLSHTLKHEVKLESVRRISKLLTEYGFDFVVCGLKASDKEDIVALKECSHVCDGKFYA